MTLEAKRAIPMTIAIFESLSDAEQWRSKAGGWIFLSHDGIPIWFATKFTPSAIFGHRATSGLSGTLL